MYQVGDTVLYGAEGVCVIDDISSRDFGGEKREYYVLKPVHQSGSTFYLPTCSPAVKDKLKKILSSEQIYELIRAMPEEGSIWIEDENERKQKYKEIIQSGDRLELIRMIRTLYFHREELKEAGRKFHLCDEHFMKEAEKLLYDEFAHVLNIPPEQVLPFIVEQVELKRKGRGE